VKNFDCLINIFSHLKLPLLFFLGVIFFNKPAQSADYSDLYAKYSEALVKIVVKQESIEISYGAGFFIDSQGLIVTSRHVLQPALVEGYKAQIYLKSGDKIEDIQYISCSSVELDLCLIRIPKKVKTWIDLKNISPKKEGSSLVVLGHPRGFDWSISDGMLSGFRSPKMLDQILVKLVQISAPISPGNSGGPVLDDQGRLIGITTSAIFARTSQNLNFAINAESVQKFSLLLKDKKPISIIEYKKKLSSSAHVLADLIYKKKLKSDLEKIEKGVAPSQKFKKYVLKSKSYSYEFKLPAQLLDLKCLNDKSSIKCEMGESVIMISEAIADKKFMKRKGVVPLKTPLIAIAELMTAKKLKESQLTAEQKKAYYSKPEPIDCKAIDHPKRGSYNRCMGLEDNFKFPDASFLLKTIQWEDHEPLLDIAVYASETATRILPFSIADFIEYSLIRK
jgi:hypothetical protein